MKQAKETIKFKAVHSDGSSIDGTMRCSDPQWDAILAILLKHVPPGVVLDAIKSERAAMAATQAKGNA